MKLTPPQQQISNSKSRFRVISAGRRFGKSFLAINELAKFARYPGRRVLAVAPTYKQVKNIIWDELKAQLIEKNWLKKANESELIATLVNGSTITLRSSENYDALRGSKYDFIVLDEVADMNPVVWTSVLRPTLSDTGGHAMFIGSPKGQGNWFFDLWTQGGAVEDWQSWQFTTLQGGNVPEQEIEAAKRDLGEREFEQEYLSRFVTWSNIIFYAFSEKNLKAAPPIDDRTPLHIGTDFNVSPISAVICIKGQDWLHVIDEIEIYGSNTLELVQEIRNRYGTGRQMYAYPDASGKSRSTRSPGISDHIILANNGFKLKVDPSNPPVAESIASVNSLLCNANGEQRLFIDPKCKKLREVMLKFSYKESTKIPNKDNVYDHLADSLRYVTHKLFPMGRDMQSEKKYQSVGRRMF
jgi:hypothetical protein